MSMCYIDFHTHTSKSDGDMMPAELANNAWDAQIRYLSITDHDRLSSLEEFRHLKRLFPNMTLIPGVEVSSSYQLQSGRTLNHVHIVVLGYVPGHSPALESAVKQNLSFNRREYVNTIIGKLRDLGLELGSYDELQERYPNTQSIGRMTIAQEMVQRRYVNSVDQAFDDYIGEHGRKLAYYPIPFNYVPMEEVVSAALTDRALPILAHPFYYCLNNEDLEGLICDFRTAAGAAPAGMEVYYGRYDAAQRKCLAGLAKKHGLLASAGSDFHNIKADRLDYHFPLKIAETLFSQYETFYNKGVLRL